MTEEQLQELVAEMTLEEKAGLCSGKDFWHTKDIERLSIPSQMLSDGPHGLRKQDEAADHLGINDSIKAVCFPAGCATAASFDRDLVRSMGEVLGNECQAEGVSVILGPAMNIKRSPLCGRNFEYYSEDPFVSGEMAGAFIKGVQSKKVGTSPKHFLANNQESRRMSASAEVDERTLREIYLAGFERAVKEAKPWTVMCSYNRINGVYASEHKTYLTGVLRDEWGFDGYVMSDWGAVNDRAAGLEAGLELEMPSCNGVNDRLIIEAVKNGTMVEAVLDQAVLRILRILFRYEENRDKAAVFDRKKDHESARRAAEGCAVLLKNDGILPLEETEEIAFIGNFAEAPRYQGGGSSHINSFQVDAALDMAKGMKNITYAKGYVVEEDKTDEKLLKEAVELAARVKTAVLFVGLPDAFESEGYDRTHMRLPDCQNRLIEEVGKVQKNTVIVLHNGSAVEMPWVKGVNAILEMYLGGEAVGAVTYDILFGKVNPSGKLPETFPEKLEHNPSYLNYKVAEDKIEYKEGIFVGYRYYDTKGIKVLFPFGHGLSYTNFEYSNLTVDKTSIKDTECLNVSVDVTNTGSMEGKEVVQLYVRDRESTVMRPSKELKGFEKISLCPGETKTVSFLLSKRDFAYYNEQIHDWYAESGEFELLIGKSSADIVEKQTVFVESSSSLPVHFTRNSTFGDIFADKKAKDAFAPFLKEIPFYKEPEPEKDAAVSAKMQDEMLSNMPVRMLVSFSGGAISYEMLDGIINKVNNS